MEKRSVRPAMETQFPCDKPRLLRDTSTMRVHFYQAVRIQIVGLIKRKLEVRLVLHYRVPSIAFALAEDGYSPDSLHHKMNSSFFIPWGRSSGEAGLIECHLSVDRILPCRALRGALGLAGAARLPYISPTAAGDEATRGSLQGSFSPFLRIP